MWKIIRADDSNGNVEYQVSNGDVGQRTMSYDTACIKEAYKILEEENGQGQKQKIKSDR